MPITTSRADVYTLVTAAILASLENNARPWIRPWSTSSRGPLRRPLRHNGEPYRGVNVLLLWAEAMAKGYASPTWMTFRQALALRGHVRRGERSTIVVYTNKITKTTPNPQDPDGDEIERDIAYLKTYHVFNVDQIAGLPSAFYPVPRPEPEIPTVLEHAEAFFAATGATVYHRGDRAYYSPALDSITLPPRAAFADPQAYAATKGHEFVHWTAHPSRLDRMLGRRFGDDAYAAEELIAELGAAFLCADLRISAPTEPRTDHAQYLQHWLSILKADRRALCTAAAHAQRATDYLHQLQPSA